MPRAPVVHVAALVALPLTLVSGVARADADPGGAEAVTTETTTTTTETPADAPAPSSGAAELPRDRGLRVGVDIGFARSPGARSANLAQGSPTLLPLGVEAGVRASGALVLGVRAQAGLASRNDCGDTRCTARSYAIGVFLEHALSSGPRFVPYLRYGAGWEMLSRGGAFGSPDASSARHALDVLDLRFGADVVVSRGSERRTIRVGPYVGMVAGVKLVDTAVSARDESGGHIWFGAGVRATADP